MAAALLGAQAVDRSVNEPLPSPLRGSTALFRLPDDVTLLLYAFLPVADLLALAGASRDAHHHTTDRRHWRDLTCRLLRPGPLLPPEDNDYRATFVRMAEAELQWRRGKPVAVRERRPMGMGARRLQSMALWQPRGLLLVASGGTLGIFDASEFGSGEGEEEQDERSSDDDDGGCAEALVGPSSLPMVNPSLVGPRGSNVTVVQATPLGPVAADMDGRVKLLDWETLRVRESLDHHTSAVWGLDTELAGAGGSPVVAASCFRRITVSDLRQPSHHHPAVSFQGHATWIRTLHMEMDRCARFMV